MFSHLSRNPLNIILLHGTKEDLARFLAISKTTNLKLLPPKGTPKEATKTNGENKGETKHEPAAKLITSGYDIRLLDGLRKLEFARRDYNHCKSILLFKKIPLYSDLRRHLSSFRNYIVNCHLKETHIWKLNKGGKLEQLQVLSPNNDELVETRRLTTTGDSLNVAEHTIIPDCSLTWGFAVATLLRWGKIKIWDPAENKCLKSFSLKPDGNYDAYRYRVKLSASPEGFLITFQTKEEITAVWDWKKAIDDKSEYPLVPIYKTSCSFTLLPKSRICFHSSSSRTPYIWHIGDIKEEKTYELTGHKFNPSPGWEPFLFDDGNSMVIIHSSGEITLWNCATGKCTGTLEVPSEKGDLFGISSENSRSSVPPFTILADKYLAGQFELPDAKQLIVVWDLKTRQRINTIESKAAMDEDTDQREKSTLAALPNGNLVSLTKFDATTILQNEGFLRIWDPLKSTLLYEIKDVCEFKPLLDGQLVIFGRKIQQIISFPEEGCAPTSKKRCDPTSIFPGRCLVM